MADKHKHKNTAGRLQAAQIFDGVMMPPKYAAEWSQQLNNDFYEINRNYSIVEAFESMMIKAKVPMGKKLRAQIAQIKAQRKAFFAKLKKENVHQFLWDRRGY